MKKIQKDGRPWKLLVMMVGDMIVEEIGGLENDWNKRDFRILDKNLVPNPLPCIIDFIFIGMVSNDYGCQQKMVAKELQPNLETPCSPLCNDCFETQWLNSTLICTCCRVVFFNQNGHCGWPGNQPMQTCNFTLLQPSFSTEHKPVTTQSMDVWPKKQ